ncbi:uncharacterized protein LOC133174017 [Saccostrea echinata]|uniref:uncharacterized protein LOC133174017 n=1 Tax=Saccostrea echinata TaxID=191078 RepID=UPI002A7EC698|nr:uncharacterized protein LOC133174017 [Saccostrea echinata]
MFVIFMLNLTTSSVKGIRFRWAFGNSRGNQEPSKTSIGGRGGSSFWQEDVFNTWVFGGKGIYNGRPSMKNDLWKYNVRERKWTLEHPGSESLDISSKNKNRAPVPRRYASMCGVPGTLIVVFGGMNKDKQVLGDTWVFVFKKKEWLPLSEMLKNLRNESIGESPDPRADAVVWCMQTKMMLFGGISETLDQYDDMWEYSLIDLNWRQEKLSSELHRKGIIRPQITYPAGRSGATAWVGHNEQLYMFSGNTQTKNKVDSHHNSGFSTDLWNFDCKKNAWVKIMGDPNKCLAGYYGKKGMANKKNIPGCRRGAIHWTDSEGHLWMFGGEGASSDPRTISDEVPDVILNDLWYFDLDYKMWSWMGGSDRASDPGSYGSADNEFDHGRYPSCRTDAMSFNTWNELYVVGGIGHDSTKAFSLLDDVWGIDVHSEVNYRDAAWPGSVFMLIFFFIGLLLVLVVTFSFARKYFSGSKKNESKKYDVEYSMLQDEAD